jgi:hypothetical protein
MELQRGTKFIGETPMLGDKFYLLAGFCLHSQRR